jgi:molybdopterin synthase sulfur carrier subunit
MSREASTGSACGIIFGFEMPSSEAVTVHVPAALREYCGGASDLPLSASSVRGALGELEQKHPSLYSNVCDETGAVRRHLNVFVNASHVRDRDGLDTPLVAGDIVTILAAVSGG